MQDPIQKCILSSKQSEIAQIVNSAKIKMLHKIGPFFLEYTKNCIQFKTLWFFFFCTALYNATSEQYISILLKQSTSNDQKLYHLFRKSLLLILHFLQNSALHHVSKHCNNLEFYTSCNRQNISYFTHSSECLLDPFKKCCQTNFKVKEMYQRLIIKIQTLP